jgi:hypothetical protein
MSENSVERSALITHTSNIVVAHISRHAVPTAELPGLIETVFNTLSGLVAPAAELEAEQKPAVSDALLQIKSDLDSSPSGDRKLLRLLRGFREQLEHHKGAGISAR